MKNDILAIDVGTKIGWTIDGMDGHTHKLSSTDTKYNEFYEFVEFLIENGVGTVVYEAAAFQPGAAIPIYHGLVGVLKAVTTKHNIKLQGIPVGTIKKIFTGKARHTVQEQEEAAKRVGLKKANSKSPTLDMCKKLGYTYEGEDGADALSVHYAYRKLYGN